MPSSDEIGKKLQLETKDPKSERKTIISLKISFVPHPKRKIAPYCVGLDLKGRLPTEGPSAAVICKNLRLRTRINLEVRRIITGRFSLSSNLLSLISTFSCTPCEMSSSFLHNLCVKWTNGLQRKRTGPRIWAGHPNPKQ